MRATTLSPLLLFTALLWHLPAHAVDPASIARVGEAVHMIQQVARLRDRYLPPEAQIEPPAPIRGNSGRFMSPRNADGSLSAWAAKALQAAAGGAAGSKAGDVAASQIAGKVPFVGGFLGGAAKKKAKQQGAIMAIGGWDFIRSSSSLSFNSLDEMAVWLNLTQQDDQQQAQALSAVMDVYPDMKKRYSAANKAAFKKAKRDLRRQKD